MRRILIAIIVCAFAAGGVAAQSASSPPDEKEKRIQALLERLEKLEKRVADVERLEKRVAELEARQPQPALLQTASVALPNGGPVGGLGTSEDATVNSSAEASPSVAAAPPQGSAAHQHDAIPQEATTYPSLKITGFADVNFSATNQPGVNSGFNLGQFVLHMASPLSKKVSYFGELSFTATPTGFNVEVERSIIRYDHNDYFKLSFGRYHTPINYWNTAFHHGSWLQTTIARPEMIQFGGRFQPVHFVGFLTEGNIPSGSAGLVYNVGVGNGRGGNIARGGDAGDMNNNRAWLVNVFSRPSGVSGLQIGGSVYRDRITTGPSSDFREWIATAHLAYTRETPEILAEYANVHHSDILTGRTFNSQAFYVQLAYRLPAPAEKWKPYYRFEYTHVPLSEPVLNVPDLVQSILGVRYDISDFAAFKSEYRNFRRGAGQPRFHGVFVQTSFTF